MKKEDREWLKEFMKLHYLKSQNEAIHKLIEIHKAFNKKL